MSLTSQLELVDSYISENKFDDALKELKLLEKKVHDSWSYIGVYKRYIHIGENEKAEKLIKKAIKKNNTSTELCALYAMFLLRQDRLEEAESYCSKIQDKEVYRSICSELNLKKSQILTDKANAIEKSAGLENDFLNIYTVTKNQLWLKDCAILNLRNGNFEVAASLVPVSFSDAYEAYFWAQVLFDSGLYYESINALEIAKSFLSDYSNIDDKKYGKISEIQLIALESDAYIALSQMEKAEIQRQAVVSNLDTFKDISEADSYLLPIITTNSALYALNTGDEDKAGDLLFYCVTTWPDFVPSLLMYADYAYNSGLEREEDEEMKALRRNGLMSIEMEKYDNRRIIPLSDALYRIDSSLDRKTNPYLSIAKMDLKYKTDKTLTDMEKTSDLWSMLEQNYNQSVKYEELLTQYTLNFLIRTNQIDEAFSLYKRYIKDTYLKDSSPESDFWQDLIRILYKVDVKSAEFGAWFASYFSLYDEALRMNEYCVYESSGILSDENISPYVSTVTCMNLADIYFSTGNNKKSLDLYGKAAGRESSSYLRSEIFYRIACIYVAEGDLKNALRSIDYSASINPNNVRSQLLKSKLTINE